MLTDSHCHLNLLDLSSYQNNLDLLIEVSTQAGVNYFLCVGVDLEHADEVIKIAEKYPNVYASVGLHPSEKVTQEPSVDMLIELANHPKVVAIGETGLDYYYNDSGLDLMRERFRTHIRAAKKLKKPLIIHSRNAPGDTISILKEESADQIKGVMHCFTESWEMAQQSLALGFYISFSGIITFKNAQELQATAKKVPLNRMLIETDAPYLTPVPFRGKPNAPHYVKYTAEKIAELQNITFEEVARQTTKNFIDLFQVSKYRKEY